MTLRAASIRRTKAGDRRSPLRSRGLAQQSVFDLLARRYLADDYSPEAAERETGIPASTIRRIAAELAEAAFDKEIRVETPWTDWTGERHDAFIGRPVAMHAMRGISAHANGFHTCRMIHLLQILLGSIDCPGGFRYKPPYPKPAPPQVKPFGRSEHVHPREPLAGPHLGFPTGPDDLLIDDAGRPTRIDKAFSWDAPLAAHGLMHAVITNAANGDPYPIDVLFMYMANMAWNSTMATPAVIGHLTAKDPATGAYKIPKIIYSDAYQSEMVAYADLILPDTTYLERWDCISLLDRPISEPDAAADAIRQPVVQARSRCPLVPGGADRSRRTAATAGLCRPGGQAEVSRRLCRLHRQPRAGTGDRAAVGLARQGRGEFRPRRRQSRPARSLHRQWLLPCPSPGAVAALHEARQPRLPRVGTCRKATSARPIR